MATLWLPRYKPKGQKAKRSRTWHIRFWCRFRKRVASISTQCRSRRNAERRLRQFLDLCERGEYDGSNPFLKEQAAKGEAFQRLRLAPCLCAYEADLRAGRVRKRGRGKPPGVEHVALSLTRLRRVLDRCRVAKVDALTPTLVSSAVDAAQQEEGFSQQTRKHYERTVKAFGAWLCSSGRLAFDPLAGLVCCSVADEAVQYPRGSFSTQQVRAIVASAATGATLRGLSGQQRSLLWLLMACTGFRVKEAAALRRRNFAADLSAVALAGEHTKNDKPAWQPLPPPLQTALRSYLAGLADDALLWPGRWQDDSAELLRADAAGVCPIGREGIAANGKALDCHSFRHYYCSQIDRAGVSERLARKLARASSGALLDRYTHREQAELVAAVAGWPDLS